MSPIGLYQSTLTLFNTTVAGVTTPITTTTQFFTPSFSAANLSSGNLILTTPVAGTGTTPTITTAVQTSVDGGVTWVNLPAVTGSWSQGNVTTLAIPTATKAAYVLNGTTQISLYSGNLLRVAITPGGTALSLQFSLVADFRKVFPDNA